MRPNARDRVRFARFQRQFGDVKPAEVVAAVRRRTQEVVGALSALPDEALLAPSLLPGWSRLTIACHLRFGAEAFTHLSQAGAAGRPAAYYPDGRDRQRPQTLRPADGESPADVVASLARASADLDGCWAGFGPEEWQRHVVEPEDNADLGPLPLTALPLLRLTEVEVHGTDLGLDLMDWSDVFVGAALPFRLEWLNRRRTNHREVDGTARGSWLLVADDGPAWLVAVDGDTVRSHPADPATPSDAGAVIRGSSRDLLALLLGRPTRAPLRLGGDSALARRFSAAFPGP